MGLGTCVPVSPSLAEKPGWGNHRIVEHLELEGTHRIIEFSSWPCKEHPKNPTTYLRALHHPGPGPRKTRQHLCSCPHLWGSWGALEPLLSLWQGWGGCCPPSHTVSPMSLLRWPLWRELLLLRVRDMQVHLALCCLAGGHGLCLCGFGADPAGNQHQ